VLARRALELLRPAVNSLGVLMLPLAHQTPDLVRVLERDLCQGAASLWVLGTTLAHRTPELFRQLHQRLPPEAHGLALAAHASAALVLAGFLRRQLPPSWTGARLRPSSETKSTVPATVSATVPAPVPPTVSAAVPAAVPATVPAPVPSTAAEAGLVVRTAHHNAAEQKAARIADWIRGGNPWAEQGFVPMSDAQRPRTGVRDRLAKQRQELAEQLSVQTAKAIGRAAPVAAAPMATMTKHEESAPESPAALHRPSKLSLPVPAPEAAASRSPPARAAEGDLLLHVTTASPSRVSSLSGASPLRPAGGSPARSPTRSPANRRVQPPVECDSCMCNPGTEYLNAGTWLRLLSAEQRRHEEGWLAKLDSEQFRVLRMKGTEPIHSGEYNDTFEQGHYACAGCGAVLYSSKHKPRSLAGHGWPAFSESLPGALERIVHPPKKIEIVCAACGGHVGHVFKSSRYPAPKHERHCVNSVSLRFMPMGALS
jgi:peptide-methionine (R)-S-oxide reductase